VGAALVLLLDESKGETSLEASGQVVQATVKESAPRPRSERKTPDSSPPFDLAIRVL
jgi:hypothetical protein